MKEITLTPEQKRQREALQRTASDMAKDPKVLKSVAASRVAIEQKRTLTLEELMPTLSAEQEAMMRTAVAQGLLVARSDTVPKSVPAFHVRRIIAVNKEIDALVSFGLLEENKKPRGKGVAAMKRLARFFEATKKGFLLFDECQCDECDDPAHKPTIQ